MRYFLRRGLGPLTMQSPSETILKAKLRANPSHPRALPFLFEALALWQGCQVPAALYADDSPGGCVTRFYPDLFVDPGHTPLYTLDWVSVARPRRRRPPWLGELLPTRMGREARIRRQRPLRVVDHLPMAPQEAPQDSDAGHLRAVRMAQAAGSDAPVARRTDPSGPDVAYPRPTLPPCLAKDPRLRDDVYGEPGA
jgi:hypothetical protein